MNKTLIGKNGYLFLINDSNNEIVSHLYDKCDVNVDSLNERYKKILNKFLLIVIPNKSFVCKQFLPDTYKLNYRPSFNMYANYLQDKIVDGYDMLNNNLNAYYKTDTHVNLYGNYLIYDIFIDKINYLYDINIEKKYFNIKNECVDSLNQKTKGATGDLVWGLNNKNGVNVDESDWYYYTDDFEQIYMNYKIEKNSDIRILKFVDNCLVDCNDSNINNVIDWNIIGEHILYKSNNDVDNNLTVVIFYDSMILSFLPIYISMFKNVYMSKDMINNNIIEKINPDYVFEFRIERFLN